MSITPLLGRPRIGTERTVTHRVVSRQGFADFLANGAVVNVAKSRDPGNSADDITTLRAGTLMGKITSSGYYAPSVIGVTTGAVLTGGTSFTVSAAAATEIVRRIGATGTVSVTGPTAANGTARTVTATYSAVNTTSGAVTITAMGVNEVQTVNLVTAATGGNLRLVVPKPDGTLALTPNIAWSATDATLLSNANTALDTATGVTGGLVATAISATDTDLGFVVTFSGTGYAGLSGPTSGGAWPLISVNTLFTSNTGSNVVRTTTGVSGAMAAGALVGDTDGSQVPVSLIWDGFGFALDTALSLEEWPLVPIAGVIDLSQVLPAVTDTGLKNFIRTSLSTVSGGKFTFSDQF